MPVIGVILRQRCGNGLQQRDTMQQTTEVLQRVFKRQTTFGHAVGDGNQGRSIGITQGGKNFIQVLTFHATQHRAYRGCFYAAPAMRNCLVKQAQTVAHTAARRARQQAKRIVLKLNIFQPQHFRQLRAYLWLRNLLEIKL